MNILTIMTIYVGVLNLDKINTLKLNTVNNQFEKDLSVLTSKRSNRCRPKYFYNSNSSIRKTTLVIPVIIKRKVLEEFFSLLDNKFLNTTLFNPHMLKMGLRGPKHFLFGDHFYSKNARKPRFHVFLHLSARKHISLFHLKWTEFTRTCEFVPI